MSVTGAYIILAVLIIRAAIKRLPRRFSYMLWAIPAVRLLCPFAIPSAASIFNIIKPVADEKRIAKAANTASKAAPVFSASPTEYIPPATVPTHYPTMPDSRTAAAVNTGASAGFRPDIGEIAACLWLTVAVGIVIYCIVCYLKMYSRLKNSRREGKCYISTKIRSPLVFGFVRPKIYLTEGLSEADSRCILAHEITHIRRHDHIVKLLCIPIAAIHWFNPLVWIGINRMYRDMELSCDEAALMTLGSECKKDYAGALLNMAMKQNGISLCGALCFGEKNIKSRIKGVLSMKKPKIIAIAAAVAVVAVSAVCLLTNAPPEKPVDVDEILNEGTTYIPKIKYSRALSYSGAEENVCLSLKEIGSYRFGLVAEKAFAASEWNDNKVYVSKLTLICKYDSFTEILRLPGENFALESDKLDSYIAVRDMKRPLIIFKSPVDNSMHLYTIVKKQGYIPIGEPITADKSPLAYQSLCSVDSLLGSNDFVYDPDNNVRITFDFRDYTYDIQCDYYDVSDVIRRYIESLVMGDVMECKIGEITDAFEYGGLAFYGEGKNGQLEAHGGVYKASYILKYRDGTEEAKEEFFVAGFVDDVARLEKVLPCNLMTRVGTIEKRTTPDGEEQIYFLDELNGEEHVLDRRIYPLITYCKGSNKEQGYSLEKIPEGTRAEICCNGDEVTPESIAYLKILVWIS